MKCLWSAFYRNENFERIITSAWNWSHVQSHFVFISFLLYSLTRAVPDHVYSKQNLRLKEIKHQVWALMFHWFSQVHRSQICLSLFTQLVSYKVFLPVVNFSPLPRAGRRDSESAGACGPRGKRSGVTWSGRAALVWDCIYQTKSSSLSSSK